MPRRRKDPDEAPIDGDKRLDRLVNKQKGMSYKLLSADDIPYFKSMGFVREERGPDAARPVFDAGSDDDPGYHVGSLTLYKAPDELARRVDGWAQKENDDRMSATRRDVKSAGGRYTSELQR